MVWFYPVMTELRIEPFEIPAASLGSENPLPAIGAGRDLHSQVKTDETYPAEDKANLGWGFPPSVLPYRLQDGFDRDPKPRTFRAAVLENEHLRATFLPELGGRLWSLFSKDSGEELLAANPVFQPCNFAVRKAWASGGIEWNFGWTGHWALTCSPLFAAKRTLPDGTPELRMWEFERVRRMPLQIDVWLPSHSKVLFVRSSIHNCNADMTPVYWWTNIAAKQEAGTRVLVSADDEIRYDYFAASMGSQPITTPEGAETTYPGRIRGSRDYFYRIPASEEHPWEIAVQPDGRGFFEVSTVRLRGRKLFLWGVHEGGESWQRFLRTPDYIEIQAGLGRTQSHHIPMPAGETWAWLEAFGECEPGFRAFSEDWHEARLAGENAVRCAVAGDSLDSLLSESWRWAMEPVRDDEITHFGSGWGALEARRRGDGEPAFPGLMGIAFPTASLGEAQSPWLTLLDGGVVARRDTAEEPGDFGTPEYLPSLEASLARPNGRNWLSLFHRGVILWQTGDTAGATASWEASCRAEDNAWARRCLGVSQRLRGEKDAGRENLLHASRLLPDSTALAHIAREALHALADDGFHTEALAFAEALPPAVRGDPRLRLLAARELLVLGRLDEAERIVADTPTPPDMREGDSKLGELWVELQARRNGLIATGEVATPAMMLELEGRFPPPPAIDFRMRLWEDCVKAPDKRKLKG